jgi:hypothetical protein
MKMLRFMLVYALSIVALMDVTGQECSMYFPSKQGTVVEYTQYDAKNKVTGTTRSTILSKENIAGGVKVSYESESFDKKGASLYKGQFAVKCENGVFYIDMSTMVSPQTMSAYKDMTVEMKSDNLDFPSVLSAGQTLKDGTLNMDISNQGMKLMSMNTTIKNRKVEAVESVTTPAGTYECYKISSDIIMVMMFTIETKSVEWYAKNVGIVKSETYDKKGKIQGSMVLSSIKN